jgi:hypothetical protein
LFDVPARHIQAAFFSPDAASETGAPDYEMDLIMHDNGVVSDIKVVYDAFSMTQSLVSLQSIAVPLCSENSDNIPSLPHS